MPYKNLIESTERAKPRIVNDQSSPASARSFQGGFHPIPQLQRTLGNRNIAQLIQTRRLTPEGRIVGLQPKLTVGAADDQYEQEADRVARQVMNTPDAAVAKSMQRAMSPSPEEDKDKMLQTKPLAASITPFVQRDMVNNEKPEEEKPLQARFLTGTSSKSLQRQPEEDKDKMLQTKPLAASITGLEQRRTESTEAAKEKEILLQAMFLAGTNRERLQRQPEIDEEETKPIQAKSPGSLSGSFQAGDDIETQISQSKGQGSQLPDPVRSYMEPRFGMDFSHVRVHTGSDAIQMNRDVNAKAFTHGSDIYYGASHNPTDLELTAHELTHVVQQTGRVPLQMKRLDEFATSGSERLMQRTCSACGADKEKKESNFKSYSVQRSIGDGHDFPPASRFSGNATLEGIFDNERVLQVGSAGAPVTLVQQALIALGYALPRFGADGDFGDETKRAVEAFQRDVGLGFDGRVGFRTIDFLDKRDRGAEVAPPVRPVVANAPFNVANAIAQPGAAPSNALGAGVWGLTFPENVQVTIDVFDNGGVWQPVLTGVTGNYSLQTRLLPGVTEVTGPAGNTNAGNYCAQINDLDSLTHAAGAWFMLSAVLAHERVHARQFRAALIDPSVITPLETAIEAITTPVTLLTPNAGVAELFIRVAPAFTAALNAAQANWLAQILVLVAADHAPGGTADTEEHAIVDPMRRRICQHARANGWPACPPLCP